MSMNTASSAISATTQGKKRFTLKSLRLATTGAGLSDLRRRAISCEPSSGPRRSAGVSVAPVVERSVSRALAGFALAALAACAGSSFTVTFPGGGAKILIAPDAQLIQQLDATSRDLRTGEKISASVTNGLAVSVLIQ